MADMKQIHEFTVKWYDKFRYKKISCIELVGHYMADDCEALGFVMDCGHFFLKSTAMLQTILKHWSASSERQPTFRRSAQLFILNGCILIIGRIPERKFWNRRIVYGLR